MADDVFIGVCISCRDRQTLHIDTSFLAFLDCSFSQPVCAVHGNDRVHCRHIFIPIPTKAEIAINCFVVTVSGSSVVLMLSKYRALGSH